LCAELDLENQNLLSIF